MRANSLYAAAALLLAACGSDPQDNTAGAEADAEAVAAANQPSANEDSAETMPPDELQPVDNAARPTPGGGSASDEMAWNFSNTAAGPKIAYGVPQTDNVRLMLRCPESGQALLSFIRPADIAEGRPDTLSIASGNARRSVTIETEQGPLGTTVKAQAPLSSGPLQQFRSGSGLEVRWGEETISVPAASEAPVRRFFEACA